LLDSTLRPFRELNCRPIHGRLPDTRELVASAVSEAAESPAQRNVEFRLFAAIVLVRRVCKRPEACRVCFKGKTRLMRLVCRTSVLVFVSPPPPQTACNRSSLLCDECQS
jgi:hypothetical protein